eukprot:769589_1
MSTLVKVKDQRYKQLVNGYLKSAQALCPSQTIETNAYYNIPPLVNYLCLIYYYMGWEEWVKKATDLGFEKVTIIARANYATLGCTSQEDIAATWKDGDKLVGDRLITVNLII